MVFYEDSGTLHLVWQESGHSNNSGIISTYYGKVQNDTQLVFIKLIHESSYTFDTTTGVSAIKLSTGRILVTWKTTSHQWAFSDNSGTDWSPPNYLPTAETAISRLTAKFGNLSFGADGSVLFTYTLNNGVCLLRSSNSGASWSRLTLITNISAPACPVIYEYAINSAVCVYAYNSGTASKLAYTVTSDGGTSWTQPAPVFMDDDEYSNPQLVKGGADSLFLYYSKKMSTPFPGIYQSDLFRTFSLNTGASWSSPVQITSYKGSDKNIKIGLNENYLTFFSSRQLPNEILYLNRWAVQDQPAPPALFDYSGFASSGSPGVVFFRTKIVHNSSFTAELHYSLNYSDYTSTAMNDNGVNGDSIAGDGIYSASIANISSPHTVSAFVRAVDGLSNEIYSKTIFVFYYTGLVLPQSYVTAGRLVFPYSNSGILGDVTVPGLSNTGGMYDQKVVLYSGGYGISGKSAGSLWAAGNLSASRIQDFLPGKIGTHPLDPLNNIYVVRNSDPAFGNSWQEYRYAVSQGAKFYDGNSDGIYTPVDLNSNGIWDANEDSPALTGAYNGFTVFHDGVLSADRRFTTMNPQGIEILQNIFTDNTPPSQVSDIFFIRYTVEYKGNSNVMDSVYFSVMADPDLGDYTDDLVGSDSSLSGGYVYNASPDATFNNAPALMNSMVQTPYTYIPGETYMDVNSNNLYDEGVDTPLDSVELNYGTLLGKIKVRGARFVPVNSFTQYVSSHPTQGDPNNEYEFRNYQIGGIGKDGTPLNICTWPLGNGSSLANCNEINPRFMYSGSPAAQTGWINTTGLDQRMMLNAGPFRMEKNKPVDILVAVAAGRGGTSLQSVDVTKTLMQHAFSLYNSNFAGYTTGVIDEDSTPISGFSLDQNFPNPFNPSTKIRFTLPASMQKNSIVTLKLYDVLGSEVAILLNEAKEPGTYEVEINAEKLQLASGVYFYKMQAGSFVSVKKLVLTK